MAEIRRSQAGCSLSAGGLHRLEGVYCGMLCIIARSNAVSEFLSRLISAYFSGSLLESMKPTQVFGIVSILPLLVGGISFLIDEKPIEPHEMRDDTMDSIKDQVSSLWGALSEPTIWKPVLFIFLWQATPSSEVSVPIMCVFLSHYPDSRRGQCFSISQGRILVSDQSSWGGCG